MSHLRRDGPRAAQEEKHIWTFLRQIHDFAFAMLVGIIAGTYSSIFVASALLLFWEKHRPGKIRAPHANLRP